MKGDKLTNKEIAETVFLSMIEKMDKMELRTFQKVKDAAEHAVNAAGSFAYECASSNWTNGEQKKELDD